MTTIQKNTARNYQTSKPQNTTQETLIYDMIVFCHLRWEFVYQRPQHIISRLSKELKILFVEEPLPRPGKEHHLNKVNPNLHVLQPNTSSIEEIADIIPSYIESKEIPFGWFYSPSFSPLLEFFKFRNVIYDCMDELSLFKAAPQHLIEQEKYLLAHADVVFTGGKSLFESKEKLHPQVYCFPSSVDQEHFSKAKKRVLFPADIANIPSPIVGYFGVIDERLDLGLLKETAQKLPQISFVMIGPVCKISEEDLPTQHNIHYLGMKSYESLPSYLKAFDIAMMPFALNEATRYISPTKTLEYMAAGKPIISTKITDVVRDYLHCVRLVSTPCEFYEEILDLLEDPNKNNLQLEYDHILEKTSWDSTANKMKSIIQASVNK
jgi:glycosyltransferase involved in cell wall biosynthesis